MKVRPLARFWLEKFALSPARFALSPVKFALSPAGNSRKPRPAGLTWISAIP
jgi:hypothetical protein